MPDSAELLEQMRQKLDFFEQANRAADARAAGYGAAKKPGTLSEAFTKSLSGNAEKVVGLDQSGPDGMKYTDPVKIANKAAGFVDGAVRTITYDRRGTDQDAARTDRELDF
ncbi:hypothetical protein [Lentzea sp. NBRC 102530]|uniref:hypothetical protein n=1 Tax=Lentzea sp. NBRC 102530 TaxID=3032201 RepID=UPI0024A40243|nr:hypothetical protein [Lentzea sp. NBRC 102530]GLY51633.1 hypothetical protein Lesp01_52890 [Lentzea sp. NBRC 102530]